MWSDTPTRSRGMAPSRRVSVRPHRRRSDDRSSRSPSACAPRVPRSWLRGPVTRAASDRLGGCKSTNPTKPQKPGIVTSHAMPSKQAPDNQARIAAVNGCSRLSFETYPPQRLGHVLRRSNLTVSHIGRPLFDGKRHWPVVHPRHSTYCDIRVLTRLNSVSCQRIRKVRSKHNRSQAVAVLDMIE